MSYNVEMYDSDDGWEGRDPYKALDTILEISPDIVGLQEVDKHWDGSYELSWLEQLQGKTTTNYLTRLTSNGYTRISGSGSKSHPELFYKTDRFWKQNSGCEVYTDLVSQFPGVDANGADMGRDNSNRQFVWARLQDKNTMKKILVISTHLHYRENTDDTASSEANALVRQYEIRLLLAWIESKSSELDFQSVVILGDMNSHYLTGNGKTTMNVYKDAGYSRTFDTAITTGDTDGTLAEGGRTTRPEWVFDYILTKGRVYTNYYSVVPNMNDKGNTAYPSDHLPIMARITCY